MTEGKSKVDVEISNEFHDRANKIIDDTIRESSEAPQLDVYYRKKAEEITSLEHFDFSLFPRRFQKAGFKEKEILLRLLLHFAGVEHLTMIQEVVKRGDFMPRTGMIILELLNKSDAIMEEGLTSRLLEFDGLAQRIKQAVLHSVFEMKKEEAGPLVDGFVARTATEQEALMYQLLDEAETGLASFITCVADRDIKTAGSAITYLTGLDGAAACTVLEHVYKNNSKKEIRKIIKKAIHKLKQKGIDVGFLPEEVKQDAVFKKIELPEARSFISSLDPEGYRLVFMVKPVTAYENKIFNILMRDVDGIHEIEVLTAMRKDSRQFIQKLLHDKKTDFLEVPPDDAVFLVEEACSEMEKQGKRVSANIEQWKKLFSDVIGVRKQPIIYDLYTLEDVAQENGLQNNIKDLFEQTDIVFWFVASEEAKELKMKITNIVYSPLVLSEQQQTERIAGLKAEATRGFFNQERQRIFKRRLEEISYILHCRGAREMAKVVLFCAGSFADPEMQPENNAFCTEMVNKGFQLFESSFKNSKKARDKAGTEPKTGSLLV